MFRVSRGPSVSLPSHNSTTSFKPQAPASCTRPVGSTKIDLRPREYHRQSLGPLGAHDAPDPPRRNAQHLPVEKKQSAQRLVLGRGAPPPALPEVAEICGKWRRLDRKRRAGQAGASPVRSQHLAEQYARLPGTICGLRGRFREPTGASDLPQMPQALAGMAGSLAWLTGDP